MMISPAQYIETIENDSFVDLIKKREELIKSIKILEKIVFSDKKESEEWMMHPGPDVRYQMDLQYLAELCNFMSEKYNNEIVWDGEKAYSGEIEL